MNGAGFHSKLLEGAKNYILATKQYNEFLLFFYYLVHRFIKVAEHSFAGGQR